MFLGAPRPRGRGAPSIKAESLYVHVFVACFPISLVLLLGASRPRGRCAPELSQLKSSDNKTKQLRDTQSKNYFFQMPRNRPCPRRFQIPCSRSLVRGDFLTEFLILAMQLL